MTHSNHVKFTVSAFLRAATGGAGAVNFQSVAGSQKPLSTRNSFDQRRDFVVVKLEKLTALAADHVVVLRVSVVMLPNFATVWTSDFPQQSGLFHCAQSPVDSRSADLLTVTTPRKSQHELICVKVLVIGKNFFQNDFSLARKLLPLRGQVLAKLVGRRDRFIQCGNIAQNILRDSPRSGANQFWLSPAKTASSRTKTTDH